jgi:UDP-N-acetylglucosamine 1-carboxyvinyltransferase
MGSFKIEGGQQLSGEIVPQGAKNEALQVICAVLLTSEPVTISNIPQIRDVIKLIQLLEDMGVKVKQISDHEYRFTADDVNLDYLETEDFKDQASALRGSVMILGPLLGRFGTAKLPKPGGDKIGRRRLDTHFIGFQKLGAEFVFNPEDSFFTVKAKKLTGCYMLLEEASVTGTANVVMASVLAQGTSQIYNAACEPYVQQLCKMLVSMGASIEGIGSNMLARRRYASGVSTLSQ